MYRRLSLTALVLALMSLSGFGQQQYANSNSKWEASFFGGFGTATDHDSKVLVDGGDATRIVTLNYASGFLVGARVTENLNRTASAELEYTFTNQPMAFLNLRPGLDRLDLDHYTHSFVYSILYSPYDRLARIRPFAAVGGGVTLYRVTSASKDLVLDEGATLTDRWKFVFSWGGGVKYRIKGNWGARFDVRDYVTGIPDYGLPPTASFFQGSVGPAFRPDGSQHNWKFSAGFIYYFPSF